MSADRSPTFALAGAAGFVAPRHMEAIKHVGGKLIAAVDPHDAVGVLDKYNTYTQFFTDPLRFERHILKVPPDYLVVCTPNFTHEHYIRMGLQAGCHVICEKPLVLNPANLPRLAQAQLASGKQIYTVLQLRFALRPDVIDMCSRGYHDVRVKYYTPRGAWYHHSWKGDSERSGGIATNIGVHIFDVLLHLFGGVKSFDLHAASKSHIEGALQLARAHVTWNLSVDRAYAPTRELTVDGVQLDLNAGFADAHNRVYREILAGNGFGIRDTAPAIQLCHAIGQRERDRDFLAL